MNHLITTPNIDAADDFYELLIDTHRDLDTAGSHALNARLILLLANHIGSIDVLREALAAARDGARRHDDAVQTTADQPAPSHAAR